MCGTDLPSISLLTALAVLLVPSRTLVSSHEPCSLHRSPEIKNKEILPARQLPIGFAGMGALPAPGFGLTPGLQLASTAPYVGFSGLRPLASITPGFGLGAGLQFASTAPGIGFSGLRSLTAVNPGFGLAAVNPGAGLTSGFGIASLPGLRLAPALGLASGLVRGFLPGTGNGVFADEIEEGQNDHEALKDNEPTFSGNRVVEISGSDVKEVVVHLRRTNKMPSETKDSTGVQKVQRVITVPHALLQRGKRFRSESKAAGENEEFLGEETRV